MMITSILRFYNDHFIGEDEELTKLKCQRNGNDDIWGINEKQIMFKE